MGSSHRGAWRSGRRRGHRAHRAGEEGVIAGVVAGVVLAATAALPFGLRHLDQDTTAVPSPGEALAWDATAFRLTALSAGLAAGSFGFIGGSLTSISEVGAKASPPDVLRDGLGIGLSSGLVVGLAFGFYRGVTGVPHSPAADCFVATRHEPGR